MSALDGRADRLYPGLTARERVLLILQAVHEGRQPDWQLRSTMPDDQVSEFNRSMGVLRGAAQVLPPFILLLEQDVRALELRMALLSVLLLWAADREHFIGYIKYMTPEPCGAEEYAAHLTAARADHVPVELAADDLINARGTWDERPDEAPDAALVRFLPLARAAEAELRSLAKQGTLPSRGRGQSLRLEAGSFYAWLGQPVPMHAEWGRGYEAVAADDLAWQREWRARVRKRAGDGPRPMHELLPTMMRAKKGLLADAQLSERDRFVRDIAERVRSDLMSLSGQYGALDAVLTDLHGQLGCEDILEPELRDRFERARASLATAGEQAVTFVGKVDLPICDTETKDLLSQRIQEAGG